MCMYHILFIHSSVNSDIWVVFTFWLLWIMLWTWVFRYLFESLLLIAWGIYPEVKMLVILCLKFLRNIVLFSIAAVLFYIFTILKGSDFSTSLLIVVFCSVLFCSAFCNSHSNGCEVVSQCGFIYISLMWN